MDEAFEALCDELGARFSSVFVDDVCISTVALENEAFDDTFDRHGTSFLSCALDIGGQFKGT
eukprot:6070504-Prorocentrum_lima.AAC.1